VLLVNKIHCYSGGSPLSWLFWRLDLRLYNSVVCAGTLFWSLAFGISSFAQNAKSGQLVFSQGTVVVAYTWIQGPETTGLSVLQLDFKEAETLAPIAPPGNLAVTMENASMPGILAPPPQINPVLNNQAQQVLGSYLVSNINFMRPGSWTVKVTVNSGNSPDTQTIPVNL
jgi:hypothetical protein